MRIACSRCQTQYDVPDEKLSRGAVKVRCSQCGHTFAVRTRQAAAAAAEPDFQSFGSPPPPAPAEPPAQALPEARFEDFDFSPPPPEPEPPAPPPSAEEPDLGDLGSFSDDALAALGELDLGDFDEPGLDLRGEPLEAAAPGDAFKPTEQVREEDLIGRRGGEAPGLADSEELPRLDIQRGPRRTEGATRPSPILAQDRRRSPLFWAVVVAAVGTLSYTGYNLYLHPEAFTFLSPAKIRSLWQRRQIEAALGVEGLSGYYRELRAGRRVFVIRGEVVNRAAGPQSLIRVEGSLFGKDGGTLATKEVFSGNVISDADLEALSDRDIEARLQNEVGDALQNMQVPSGGRVPFTVVFPAPPDGVDKFSARPVAARSDSGT